MTIIHILLTLDVIAAVLTFGMAVFILIKKLRTIEGRLFFLIALAFGVVPLANFFIDFSKNPEIVSFWLSVVMLSPLILGPSILFLSAVFPVRRKVTLRYFLSLLPSLAAIWYIFTPLNVESFTIYPDKPTLIVTGPLYAVVALMLVIYMILALINFSRSYRKTLGVKRLQARYIYIGLLTTLITMLTTNMLAPIFNAVWLPSVGPLFSLIFLSFTAYAILKYQLMDIRIVIQKSFIYSSLLLFVVLIYSVALLLANVFLEGLTQGEIILTAGLTLVFLVFTIPILQRKFTYWTDRFFFKDPIHYEQISKELTHIASAEADLKNIIGLSLQTIREGFKISQVNFIFCSQVQSGRCTQYIADQKGLTQTVIKTDRAMISFFDKKKGQSAVLLAEDLANQNLPAGISQTQARKILSEMDELKTALCFSVMNRGVFAGIVCLGGKLNGDPFFINDIEWFALASSQLGVAIERGALYENLEQLVDLRTRQLEAANHELRKISEAKSEYVSVASHQLRSPLTVIKSIFSMMNSGDLGKMTKLQAEYAEKGRRQSERLIILLNQLLNISRIEAGKLLMNIKKVSLGEMIRQKASQMEGLANDKGLKLILGKLIDKPSVPCDPQMITEVIENLLDNAIKYTDAGEITVEMKRNGNWMGVTVTDSGIGIPKEDLPQLFQRFVQGEGATKALNTGFGLGLYFCRKVMEAHGGRISVDSQGVGSGSSFTIELPIEENSDILIINHHGKS